MGLALALGLVGAPAFAQTAVYHSPNDNGVNPGTPLQLPVGPWESLYLYVNAGTIASTSGVACAGTGNGQELCAYELTMKALGGASFQDFLPAPGVVRQLTTKKLVVNGLFALAPVLGPVRIGELKVASSAPGGEVMVESGKAWLAGLQKSVIPPTVVATTPVPEPGGLVGLGAGVLLLGALYRRALRRSARAH